MHSTEIGALRGFGDLLGAEQISGARAYQEDSFRTSISCRDVDLLMVLADGMGGHRGGAEASRLAIASFCQVFDSAQGTVADRLRVALDGANEVVGRCAAEDARYRGMGCTLVACAIVGEQARWISVGDSPLWRIPAGKNGDIERLNEDHSMKPVLEKLVLLGRMSEEDAASGPIHQLRAAVTGDELGLVDEGRMVDLGAGDWIVIASDGLETLSEESIRQVCGSGRAPGEVVAELLNRVEAMAQPSQDNVTVITYKHAEIGAVKSRRDRLTARTIPLGRVGLPAWSDRLVKRRASER